MRKLLLISLITLPLLTACTTNSKTQDKPDGGAGEAGAGGSGASSGAGGGAGGQGGAAGGSPGGAGGAGGGAVEGKAPAPRSNLTADQKRILDEVVKLETLDHNVRVFGAAAPLGAGAVVKQDGHPADKGVTLAEASLLFVIDDHPESLLEHPLRYALLGVASQQIKVYSATAFPRVNGALALPASTVDLLKEETLVYTTAKGEAPTPAPEFPSDVSPTGTKGTGCANPQRYATVASGGGNFSNAIDTAAVTIFHKLETDGFGVSGAWGTLNPGGAKAALMSNLAAIAAKAQCCDTVVIAIAGHGSRTVSRDDGEGGTQPLYCGEDSQVAYPEGWKGPKTPCTPEEAKGYFLKLGDQPITDDELSSAISGIKSCNIQVMIEACHSGGFIPKLSKKNGVANIFTSASEDELSAADDPLGEHQGTPAFSYMADNWAANGDDYGKGLNESWAAGQSANPNVKGAILGWLLNKNQQDKPQTYNRMGECKCCEKTFCPCEGHEMEYQSESECSVLCPSGLACFATLCQEPTNCKGP